MIFTCLTYSCEYTLLLTIPGFFQRSRAISTTDFFKSINKHRVHQNQDVKIQKTTKGMLNKFVGKMETSGKLICSHQKNVILVARKMGGDKKGAPARRLARKTSF